MSTSPRIVSRHWMRSDAQHAALMRRLDNVAEHVRAMEVEVQRRPRTLLRRWQVVEWQR